jgi:hypothetical protein
VTDPTDDIRRFLGCMHVDWDGVLRTACAVDHARDILDKACGVHPDHVATATANADLVAAAPELLAACEAMPLDMLAREDDLDASNFKDNARRFLDAMRKAAAAIARAKGAMK